MTVNEVSRASGVPAHTVRYYTRIGLLRPAGRRDNGYKEFTEREVARLKFIRRAQRLGFTLADIEEVIARASRGDTPCPRVRQIVQQRLVESRGELTELVALVRRMEAALRAWSKMKDGVPDGNAVCALIEALDDA
jgi:MerR family transcriptional regulator, Zn(II)-responsive regulator of zntA